MMTQCWRLCLLVLIFLGAPSYRSVAQTVDYSIPVGTIHVTVVGPFGEKVPNPTVRLYSSDRRQVIGESIGTDGEIKSIAYGSYILSAWEHGGGMGERPIVVNSKDVWIRIGLSLSVADKRWPGGSLNISGQIKPTPPSRDSWWIRVDGVYLAASRESPVNVDGVFSVYGLEMGAYVIQLFEGSKLLHARTVEIDPKQQHTKILISLPTREFR